ncbi:hypothetical protein DY000_02062474 [Brassica cretica]|uniref:Uncharacterized protein n=1 Tax=Brassica cretica TaxID=69181 RepID=A0ABQ7B243_BRACR|nr:hypothetical protein DY000_02062474 [Brassica cretica]
MYSALISDSNGGETWNKAVINDGPIRMRKETVREVPPAQATEQAAEEVTHPDPEGGNGNGLAEAQTQPGENSVAHDQDEMPSELDVETQVEASSEGNEAEPEQLQPL